MYTPSLPFSSFWEADEALIVRYPSFQYRKKYVLTFSQKDVKYIFVLVRGLAINMIVEVG
jgi:hypothetical protein